MRGGSVTAQSAQDGDARCIQPGPAQSGNLRRAEFQVLPDCRHTIQDSGAAPGRCARLRSGCPAGAAISRNSGRPADQRASSQTDGDARARVQQDTREPNRSACGPSCAGTYPVRHLDRPLAPVTGVRCRQGDSSVRFTEYSFGSVQVDGVTYDHDLIIDRGKIRKRKKAASKKFRGASGHTPLSVAEDIPWRCRRLVIGSGADGALPVMEEVREQARRRKVDLVVLPTAEAIGLLAGAIKDTNAVLHVTC